MNEMGRMKRPSWTSTTSFFGRAGEGEPVPPPTCDECRILHGIEDLLHGVAHGSTKQAGELAEPRPAFMSWAVRQELREVMRR